MQGITDRFGETLRHRAWCAAVTLALLAGLAGTASAFETTAPTAILLDYETGAVLFEKDADEPVPPASLAKLMTAEVIFDELETGRIALEDEFTVSEHAWRTGGASSGGSTMFLPLDSRVSVGDLIKGIVVQSGNDASIVAAEGIAGSVEAFAAMMNRRAEAVGLSGSHFVNPHGLPDPEQYVTMRDLATLATHLIREHPEHYEWFSLEEFTYNEITQQNRNPLLGLGMGADGLKTGHTSEAGYGLVASAEQDGRRLVLAMSGMQSTQERSDEARKLLGWGFSAFEEAVLLSPGETAGEASIAGGVQPSVTLVGQDEVSVLKMRGSEGEFVTSVAAEGPFEAPVAQGDRIGTFRVTKNGATVREVPLYAAHAVERASFFSRVWDAMTGSFLQ